MAIRMSLRPKYPIICEKRRILVTKLLVNFVDFVERATLLAYNNGEKMLHKTYLYRGKKHSHSQDSK